MFNAAINHWSSIEAIANVTFAQLASVQPVLTSLLVFAIGICLAHIAFKLLTKFSAQTSLSFAQTVRLAVIALFATVALQHIWLTSNILNGASGQAEVVTSRTYQTNVSLGETNVAIGGGGYVTGIFLHPLQKDLVYIKTDVGGFYRWNSANKSWVPLTDHFPIDKSNYYGGEALALDPKDPNIVYIAAGKYVWDEPGTIFKSNDRGATWKKLDLDLPMGGNQDRREVGQRLVINPFNSKMILFGSRRDGLWKSLDAGANWSKVTSFPGKPEKDIGITAIVFDKDKSGLVYANAYGDGIYKSTNAGITWSKIDGSPKKAMRLVTSRNNTLYTTINGSPGVKKYTDGDWKNITPQGSKEDFNGLSINPANPNDILVSTKERKNTKIYRSFDGGTTWKEQNRSLNNSVPWWSSYMLSNPSVSAIEFDPHVSGRVWFTDWYGIWRTDNINKQPSAWTNYQKGHEEIVTFTLVAPPSGALLLSGIADVDGFYHNKGLDSYPSKTFSDSGPSFQDTYSIAYYEKAPLQMVRVGGNRWNNTYSGATSTDGGLTWKEFASFPKDTMPMRIAISATNPKLFVVTVSGDRALRTDDGGASWKEVAGLPKGSKGPWNWSLPLAADKVDGDTFYYYKNGKFYQSTDGGLSFKVVNSSLPDESWHSLRTVSGVKGEIWLSLDKKQLYRSTDGGKTFSKMKAVKRSYLFALGKPQQGSTIPALYVYGEIDDMGKGIFRSLDRGKTWKRIGNPKNPIGNSPNVMEASLQQFGLVFIGTNGRGIYYGNR